MALYCELDALVTESDVEQKFIYSLLTFELPVGLGINSINILTKQMLRQVAIGKGNKKKYYFPDYLISIRGIPLLVLEAKKPDEDLEDAFSEARLYAEEINAQFDHNINVCQKIIACNGNETWIGFSDQAEPIIKLKFEDFQIENPKFVKMLEFCSNKTLEHLADKLYIDLRREAIYKTPVSNLGGKKIQNEELEENSFGRTFVFKNRKVFDPETEEEKNIIVKNAYIKSAKREQHIDPIYKEIRKFEIPNNSHVTQIATSNPQEIVQSISNRIEDNKEEYSLLLLIGNVGSGKSTFIRYFKTVFLKTSNDTLYQRCDWIFLNMNLAPLEKNEIYVWLKKKVTEQIKVNHCNIDFDELDVIKKIFRIEIKKFDKGIGQFLKGDLLEYNKKLYEIVNNALQDDEKYLTALLNFLKGDYGMIPIIVLDNCDKRNKDEQLLMFEVAQWLRTSFKCIVILPMRDSTYDAYRNEPPLDTVVKDLVFRIDPPDLLKVLQARLDYITRITNQNKSEYLLSNGMKVTITENELVEYFRSIMAAIRNNKMITEIFYRLSDRNTRNGIQLFEDFCKSGHILPEEILAIRASSTYDLELYKFMNALLRKNRKYYNDEESNFVNLFHSDYRDTFPDPFVRVDILMWLKQHKNVNGPNQDKGVFPVNEVVKELQLVGHEGKVVYREINALLKRGLIISETLLNEASEQDLIKITLSGSLHLSLLKEVNYLSACSENVLYKDLELADKISKRLASSAHLSKVCTALNARDMVNYLEKYRQEYYSSPEVFLSDGESLSIYNLEESKEAVDKFIRNDNGVKSEIEKIEDYRQGKKVLAEVVSKEKGALVLILDGIEDIKGFLSVHEKRYNLMYDEYKIIKVGDKLTCEIENYDYTHSSFQLKYLNKI